MTTTLAALPKGHRFPRVAFDLSAEWVRAYMEAVEDGGIGLTDGCVPPMAIAALSIRALLESAALPPGALHLGQELAFQRAVHAGDRLFADAEVASRGERQGWVLMGIDVAVSDDAARPVMTGRATVTFPMETETGA